MNCNKQTFDCEGFCRLGPSNRARRRTFQDDVTPTASRNAQGVVFVAAYFDRPTVAAAVGHDEFFRCAGAWIYAERLVAYDDLNTAIHDVLPHRLADIAYIPVAP